MKKKQEAIDKELADKAKRKADRKARREAVTYTSIQTQKVFSMVKDGKSWDDISKELNNGANARDIERHYNSIKEFAASVIVEKEEKEKVEESKGEEEKAKENGNGKNNKKDKGKGKAKEQSDEEKIEIGKKAEENEKAKDGGVEARGGGDHEGGSPTFSNKQTKKINGMKKGGKSWDEIAKAVGNGVTAQDVENRWKEMNPESGDAESSKDAPGAVEDEAVGGGIIDIFGGADIVQNASPPAAEDKSPESPNSSKSEKGKAPEKKDSSSSPIPVPASSEYLGTLKPDGFFSEYDCDILETLIHRESEQKWHRIQAMFANCTGRMVDIWILENKAKEMLL